MAAHDPQTGAPPLPDSTLSRTALAPVSGLSRLGASAPLLLAVAGLLAALALALRPVGGDLALVASVPAAVLALAAGAGLLSRRWRLDRRRSEGNGLAALLAQDPDPVLVTDAAGVVVATTARTAEQPDPRQRLAMWSVDPAALIDTMLREVAVQGHAERHLRRADQSLRLTATQVANPGPVVVWRFAAQARDPRRTVESLGLPVLSRDGAGLSANAAARALLDPGEPSTAALFDAAGRAPATVTLPGGERMQAIPLMASDGALDLLLLGPETSLPAPGRAGLHSQDYEDIPVALAQIDADGRMGASNRLARSLLGVEGSSTPFFWEVVEGLGRPVPDWLDDARAGRALGRPEVMRANLSGPETFVQVILRRGPMGSLIAVLSDATELKSLEARFVQSQKMQAIGQLAGGIAHDFNNLLTAISGHCDLLLLNRDRFDPDHDDLLQIHQNANRAAALVRQLLAFSRKQTLRTEVLGLETLLEDLTHLLTRLVGERIALTLAHDPQLGPIRADRRQLEQVIMNLVVNARDAMPMGGTIRIETESIRLSEEMVHGRARVPPGTYARIRVIDQGIGIPAEIIDKIFEPFFTTKKLGEGTGLGLSTAYGIVKQMGGFIFCDSVEGAGTVFSLYFAEAEPGPLRHAPPAEPAMPPPEALPRPVRPAVAAPGRPLQPVPAAAAPAGTGSPPQGRTILLVEDEAPVRAFAARALRHRGFQVYEAQDGEQALEFLHHNALRIDLFVTDVIMPGIDGPGWVTRALAERPGTPVVFISGYTEDTLSAALTRIPRSVFLGKPFSLGDLSDTIARQLQP